MNLVLIGYRGAGKTLVAQRLALALGWNWVDADVEIELAAGASIKAIFEAGGEARFREFEAATLQQLAERDQTVIAAGGGVVLREENRRLLAAMGKVIWLKAPIDALARRIAIDATTAQRRPNLTAQGGRDEIARLLAQREPLYRQCADLEVETADAAGADRDAGELAAEIIARLQLASGPGEPQ